MMLSMEIASTPEPALYQSWLIHITFHTRLLIGIMQSSSKRQMILITLQKVCAIVVSLFHPLVMANLYQPARNHFVPGQNVPVTWPLAPIFFYDVMVTSSRSKGLNATGGKKGCFYGLK